MAWKLLKDVPKSAARKAQRRMSSMIYFCSVTKTTCRGHFLGVLASWFVQVGIFTIITVFRMCFGDVSGPIIVAFCFDKVLHLELR
uniref:Uncharacterized protein n=1 Tax=Solanum tuberosum TaxID=4113 RepID=M1BWB6_SOLTU